MKTTKVTAYSQEPMQRGDDTGVVMKSSSALTPVLTATTTICDVDNDVQTERGERQQRRTVWLLRVANESVDVKSPRLGVSLLSGLGRLLPAGHAAIRPGAREMRSAKCTTRNSRRTGAIDANAVDPERRKADDVHRQLDLVAAGSRRLKRRTKQVRLERAGCSARRRRRVGNRRRHPFGM